jgi:hypothetical protein
MLQRIQTLYLLIITALSVIVLFFPQAGMLSADLRQYEIGSLGVFHITNTGSEQIIGVLFLTVLEIIIPVMLLIIMFLYKKRILQIRLLFINIILMLGVYAMLFFYLITAAKTLQADWHLNIIAAFPLVNIVLSFLAIRAIGRDEALVKSLNRLR